MKKVELITNITYKISECIKNIEDINESFTNNNIRVGFNILTLLIDQIQVVLDTVVAINECVEIINIDEINQKLNEIVDAINNEDYILVGDLFSYEIRPILENIRDKVNAI